MGVKSSGVDVHPQYQRGFDFERAEAVGHDFCFVKVSEGPYRDGTVWNAAGWDTFARKAARAFPLVGYYHFLVNSHPDDHAEGGRAQAELFWRRVKQLGGAKGRMLCVDFEHYSDKYPWLSPYNATLKAFVRRLKELSDGHPVVLYTTEGYWQDTGTPSGPVRDYDIDLLWEARYPYGEARPLDHPIRHFENRLANWETPWKGFNGEDTGIIQFTPAGLVAGRYVDVNASKHALKDLRAMAVAALPNEDEDHPFIPEPNPHPSDPLRRNIEIVSGYGNRLTREDIDYWCWDGDNLNVPRPGAGRPASVDGPAPDPSRVRRGFCADLVSWQLRKVGKPIPKNRFGNENYDGGTRAFRLRYKKQMIPFRLSAVRKGGCGFVDFQTRWAPEGHIMFFDGDGPDAPALQSHLETSCAAGEPGFNRRYTVRESHDGGYYTHIIPAHVLWGDAKIRV